MQIRLWEKKKKLPKVNLIFNPIINSRLNFDPETTHKRIGCFVLHFRVLYCLAYFICDEVFFYFVLARHEVPIRRKWRAKTRTEARRSSTCIWFFYSSKISGLNVFFSMSFRCMGQSKFDKKSFVQSFFSAGLFANKNRSPVKFRSKLESQIIFAEKKIAVRRVCFFLRKL